MEPVPCGLCGSDRPKRFWKGEGFTYVRCPVCGLIYQNPRYTFRHLRTKVYTRKYFHYEFRNQDNFFHLMRLNIRDAGLETRSARFGTGRKFLDIGCATGLLLNEMRSKGWETTGVELCRASAEYARKHYGLRVVNSTLEKARFRTGSFHAVHLSHVIEHLPDPKGSLAEIRRILRPGGLFLIVTPNVDSFQARWFGTKWRSAHKDHLTLFSTSTLRRMLSGAGFQVIRQFSYGGIALGLAPVWIKKPADRLAKLFNIGDVTAFLCLKPGN